MPADADPPRDTTSTDADPARGAGPAGRGEPRRVLLLEDDPVSARFLRDALAALPARVDAATTLAQAAATASAADAAWVFDARLPDGHAADLLPRLRARGWLTPALALSADVDGRTRERLLAAGFAEALAKPIGAEALRGAVRALLAAGEREASGWDDVAARNALGSADAVRALRTLFLAELPAQHRAVREACLGGDHAAAGEILHRMTSGCGFVGAPALQQAVRALRAAPDDPAALARFEACVRALSAAGPTAPAASSTT